MQTRVEISGKIVEKALEDAKKRRRYGVKTTKDAHFRLHPIKHEKAMQICGMNSVTLSDYLRECVQALFRENLTEEEFRQLAAACGEG